MVAIVSYIFTLDIQMWALCQCACLARMRIEEKYSNLWWNLGEKKLCPYPVASDDKMWYYIYIFLRSNAVEN